MSDSAATGSRISHFRESTASQSDHRGAREQLIPWWDAERLERARVVMAGVGAIGNELLKGLALVGIGRIIVIDFDTVSPSNLSRSVLFRDEDVGKPKAVVAARRAKELNPGITVIPVHGDLRRDLALSTLRDADVVLGGLDNIEARFTLNRRVRIAGATYIDSGISDAQAQVSRFHPEGGACYECNFTENMRRRFTERYSCTGLVRRIPDRTVPTTIVGASVAAALQLQDALRFLHDAQTGLRPGQRLSVLFDNHRQVLDDLPENPDCLAHAPRAVADLTLADSPHTLTPALLAAAAGTPEASVSLGFDIVERFSCPACGTESPICRPAAQVYEDEAPCPNCGRERQVWGASEAGPDSPAWNLPLATLGVTARELLRVGPRWVEIGGPDPWLGEGASDQ
ncbi:MAG: ThiF family adenylyltransferase [Thermomicrobiales bacterium]